MDKNVRFIFKVLLGTAALIVISALIVEFLNISLISLQMHQMIKTSARQACVLFSQETYKQKSQSGSSILAGSVNMRDIYTADGSTVYVSGTFYPGVTTEDIYNKLYNLSGTDANNYFKNFVSHTVKTTDAAGNPSYRWYNIGLLTRYMLTEEHMPGGFNRTTLPDVKNYTNSFGEVDIDRYMKDMDEYTEYALAKSYRDTYVTPLNFGVPYMDRDVLTNIFRWNITQILSNCNSQAIVEDKDNPGQYYVSYSGYKIYASEAKITTLQYEVFDLTDPTRRSDFENMTHINADNLSFSDDITYLGTQDDERRRICVIGIEYSVPVGYEGVTWLSPLIGWVSQMSTKGLSGNQVDGGDFSQKPALTGGGLEGDITAGKNGVLPIPGKLIYYVVR